eukprot:COSAG02_NODE_332_length_24474_cov_23.190949_7_plen_80_part_00
MTEVITGLYSQVYNRNSKIPVGLYLRSLTIHDSVNVHHMCSADPVRMDENSLEENFSGIIAELVEHNEGNCGFLDSESL